MEKATVVNLLEKYWQAETTVEEERALADWFNSQDPDRLDPDLQSFYNLFAYFEEESCVSPGADFETRILQAITPVGYFSWGMVSAAATVLVIVAGLFLFEPATPTRNPVVGNPVAKQKAAATRITDTYDNPEQALAAVRHALLIASVHLNEGRKQISNK